MLVCPHNCSQKTGSVKRRSNADNKSMLDRCLTWIYALVMKACVRGWGEDPAVSGPHKLTPVTCADTIKSLEALVKALSHMLRRDVSKYALSADSAIVSDAKKLLEPDAGALCGQFFLIPRVRFHGGRTISDEMTVKCAEPLGHDGYCISKEGWIRPERRAA